MDKTEIMSPVKSFWNIFQEKILNSHRFLSDKVGAFSTFSSAVFAWYYFTKCTNKFQFVSTDLEKIGTKKDANSMFTLPYLLVNEEIGIIPTGNSDTSKVCNEEIIKSNKKSAIMRNWSGICSNIYSDEEMESLARKYDDNYKEFWENTVLHSANEKDPRKSDTHLNDKVLPKFEEIQEIIATSMKSRTDKEKGDEAENPRDSNRPHAFSKNYKWNQESKKNAYTLTPSFASMPIFKDEDKRENKRKRYCKTKRPNSSSYKDRRRKENIDPNSKKIHSRSLTDSSFQRFMKKDVTQVVAEKLKKEKERRERIERMKKDREEMLAKIKADRKIRAEMVRKTREQLALKEAEELERKKNLRMMKERRRKNKEITTNQSCVFKLQSRTSSRGTFNIFCNSSSALDTRLSKQRKELCSPTESQRTEKCRPHSTETQTKDDNSIKSYPSLLSQKHLDLETDKVADMFTDETLINETSKAFQKLLEAVKLYEKDTEPDEDYLYGRELYNHCKNELGKYKALVEELRVWDNNESRRFPWKNAAENQAEVNKLEIIIHKKVNLELPVRKEIENTT